MYMIYGIQSNTQIYSITGVPEEKRGAESLFKETQAANFTNLGRVQVYETNRSSYYLSAKDHQEHYNEIVKNQGRRENP